jgi:hypothetical protein
MDRRGDRADRGGSCGVEAPPLSVYNKKSVAFAVVALTWGIGVIG